MRPGLISNIQQVFKPLIDHQCHSFTLPFQQSICCYSRSHADPVDTGGIDWLVSWHRYTSFLFQKRNTFLTTLKLCLYQVQQKIFSICLLYIYCKTVNMIYIGIGDFGDCLNLSKISWESMLTGTHPSIFLSDIE